MKINKDWYEKNRMPKNPTLKQQMEWHIAHATNCVCRQPTEKLRAEIERYQKRSQ
jgi:hypothetical protein